MSKANERRSKERRCRVCGCDDLHACDTLAGPCHWVAEDLCSGCVEMPPGAGDQGRLLTGVFVPRPGLHMVLDEETKAALEQPITINTEVGMVLAVISTLQLAGRHPQFNGPTRIAVEGFARDLQDAISLTPQLRSMLQAGWNPEYDLAG